MRITSENDALPRAIHIIPRAKIIAIGKLIYKASVTVNSSASAKRTKPADVLSTIERKTIARSRPAP